jgi:hypothetical protein
MKTGEVIAAALGFALVLCAAAARQTWLDRHFLPSFFLPRHWYVLIETVVRVAIAIVGLLLAGPLRRPIARAVTRKPKETLSVIAAAVLAVVASEWILRHVHIGPTEWLSSEEEPRRRPDAHLGWVLEPSRTGHSEIGGRTVDYAIDAAGYRVRRVEEPVDPARPTLVFAGESVMFGEGLMWDETIPAQVARLLDTPSANLAVHGYSSDQIYLRLTEELPRFQRPVAVVSIFMTTLFGRNLDQDRPHLGEGLVRLPAQYQSRLGALSNLLVPFRADRTVDRGVRVTREVLHATADLARAHSAMPLILVPQFGPEDPAERALRQRILDDGIPYLLVPVDGDWRLAWDRHPNARAARVIARAVAARLGHP